MSIALYVIAGIVTLGALIRISLVGKPRKPLGGGEVAVSAAIDAAVVVFLILAALKLH